jgi:hypothetical protein
MLDGSISRLLAIVLLVAVSAGFSGCGGGKSERTPDNRLIVLGRSIGGIRLDEPREAVEKAFGPGSSTRRGLVSYFGGRLVVDYWFHDQLTARVESLETGWSGFHTRSGVHVGSLRKALNTLHVDCSDGRCGSRRQVAQTHRGPGSRCDTARSPRSTSLTANPAEPRELPSQAPFVSTGPGEVL